MTHTVRFSVALTNLLWASALLSACGSAPDAGGAAGSSAGSPQDRLASPIGVVLDCPLSTNCVNSLDVGGLAPLRYEGSTASGMAALQATLALFPEAKVLRTTDVSVDAIFTTPMGFVDEVTFRLSPQTHRIDFRSRSKIGLYDFNKNRSRMTVFSAQFAAQTRR